MVEILKQSNPQKTSERTGCPHKERPHYPFLGIREKYKRIFVKDLRDPTAIEDVIHAFYTDDTWFSLLVNEMISLVELGGSEVIVPIKKILTQQPKLNEKVREWVGTFSALFTHHVIEKTYTDAVSNTKQEGAMKMSFSYSDLFGIMSHFLPDEHKPIVLNATGKITQKDFASMIDSESPKQSNSDNPLFLSYLNDSLPILSQTDFQSLKRTLMTTLKMATFDHLEKDIDSVLNPLKDENHPAHHLLTIAQNLLNFDKGIIQYPLKDHLLMGGISGSNIYYDALFLIPFLMPQRATRQEASISEEEKRYILTVYQNSTPLFGSLAFGPLGKTTLIEMLISENRDDAVVSRFLPECFTIQKSPSGILCDRLMFKKETVDELRSPKALNKFVRFQAKQQRKMAQKYISDDMMSERPLEQLIHEFVRQQEAYYSIYPPYELGAESAYMCAAAHSNVLRKTQELIGKTWAYYYVPLINAFAKKVQ